MKQDLNFHGLCLYTNDSLALIVSGVGKVRSAIATTRLIERERINAIINIGICGTLAGDPIGSGFLINRIEDLSSKRTWYPDCAVRSGCQEASLCTVDQPSPSGQFPSSSRLVDMEASGYFEAANHYLAPSRILVLKIVSDENDGTLLKKERISELLHGSIHALDSTIEALSAFLSIQSSPLSQPELPLFITEIMNSLRLTAQERFLLSEEVTRYGHCFGNPPCIELVSQFIDRDAPRTKVFSSLIDGLRSACRQTPAPL